MNFSQKKIAKYCEAHTTRSSDLATQLERETNLKTLAPQMISGAYQGKLLQILCSAIKPKLALEIGTFTGYAALHLAKGLGKEGVLHTIEANKELAFIIEKYIKEAQVEHKVVRHYGDAMDIIPNIEGSFDLVFIDAGKRMYANFYDKIIERINPGGLILVDNVLWSGKVVQQKHDKDTTVIHDFNKKVHDDPRVENIILPIRDGLLMAVKK